MSRALAPAKLNLALVVGARRPDGKHEVTTVLQRIELADELELTAGRSLAVTGFPEDTLVRRALEALAAASGQPPAWEVRISKRVPVASGLGGGSSDAATALRLANETLPDPLPPAGLSRLASSLGADVPFFLHAGSQLGEGDGSGLTPLDLPRNYAIVLVLPRGARKASTADVYDAFDRAGGSAGYEERRSRLMRELGGLGSARDLARLPPNDLAASPLAAELVALGAIRADVSGAGPTVYGLFDERSVAAAAAARLKDRGRVWLTAPAWYV